MKTQQFMFDSLDNEKEHLSDMAMAEDFADHSKDEDCAVDPETNECSICHVLHGDPCMECGGRGFHKPNCPVLFVHQDDPRVMACETFASDAELIKFCIADEQVGVGDPANREVCGRPVVPGTEFCTHHQHEAEP